MHLLYSQYFTSDISGHQMCGGFYPIPSNPQLTSHQLGFYNLIQFSHYLPGDSLISHRLSTQSHKTGPQFRCQLQVQVLNLWVIALSLGLIN